MSSLQFTPFNFCVFSRFAQEQKTKICTRTKRQRFTKKFDETPSEKYLTDRNPATKPVLSGDLINMIITENRLQNTELRLSVMKMNDKLDSLISEQQRHSLSAASNNSNNEENIKKAMNKMFKQLKSEIDPNETYTGQEVVKLVATCVKNSIE